MAEPPDDFENQEQRRKHKRQRRSNLPADVDAEKRTLDLEEALLDEEDARAGATRKQKRADLWRTWGQTTNLKHVRRIRDALFRFAPELQVQRLILLVDMIAAQKILHNQLMAAHVKMVTIHEQMGTALLDFLERLPPIKDLSDPDVREILRDLEKLLTKYANTNPFLYTDKIENVTAKLTALMERAGLTAVSARRLGIDLDEELRRYLGEVATQEEEGAPSHETNPEKRKRLMREQARGLTHDPADPVDVADEEEPEEEEEADE